MGMLRLDWNVVATIINLIVLYLLMRRFLFQPIQNMIDKRKELIDSRFNKAKDEQTQVDQLKEKYQGLMSNAKNESDKIVEEAREQANSVYEDRLNTAKHQTDYMLESARDKIESERDKMLHELESQISSLAMCAAAKVIGRNASKKYDKALYEQFLNEAGDSNDTDY